MFEPNDLVKTPQGFFGSVTWSKEGNTAIKYVEHSHYPGYNVFPNEELVLIKRGVKEFWGRAFTRQTEDELNAELGEERALRCVLPSPEERAKRKKGRIEELLGELTEEEQKEFLAMMKAKKGD